MKLKKMLALFLALTMSMALAACSRGGGYPAAFRGAL